MKKIISIILTLCLMLTFTNVSFADNKSSKNIYSQPTDKKWPKAPSVTSPSAILMDADTGTILYGKNIDKKYYPASTTKLLTSIIALENANLDEKITFSHNAVYSLESGSTHIGIKEDEKITMKDALYALLLASANEVANGIAEHVGGSIDNFAAMMNSYAKKIGCTNSNFMNPSGLHNDKHYTTAHDLALIGKYALTNPIFAEITKTKTYTIGKTNITNEKRTFSNHHQMLMGTRQGFTQYKYDGCIGGKTGYTTKADHTLVTFAKRDNMTLIAVVMNTSVHDQYKDSTSLLDYGFNKFTSYNISNLDNDNTIPNADAAMFDRYYSISNYNESISIDSNSSIILPKTAKIENASKDITFNDIKDMKQGENIIGSISYSYDNVNVGSTNIIFNYNNKTETPVLSMPSDLCSTTEEESTESKDNTSFKSVIIKILKVAGIILCILLILFIIYLIIRHIKYKRKRYSYRVKRHRKSRFDDLNF